MTLSAGLLAAADAPYPASRWHIAWDADAVRITGGRPGDNWPITWGDDDIQYTAYGDGRGFSERAPLSLGFAKITGDPGNLHAEDLLSDADTPKGGGKQGIKTSGLLMVNGVLYMFVRNYMVDSDYRHARLAWSRDHGPHWTWAEWYFSGTFGCPEFVQFGRNYHGARDGYVYVVSQANDSAYEFSPDIVLARVPKDRVAERGAYEFFAGAGAWSRDLAARKPIFTDPRGTQRVAITYNAGLRRYFLTTSHRVAGFDPHSPALGVFDAPEPWGPWTTVDYDDHWSGKNRTYHHKFPTRWMSADGKTMWLLFSGLDGADYTFCLRRAALSNKP